MASILAFDLSLRSTGWAYWDTADPAEAVAVGAIQPKNFGLPRIRTILREIEAVRLMHVPTGLDLVVVEGFPYFLFAASPGKGGDRDKFHRTEHGNGPGNQVFGIAEATGCIKMKWHFQWMTPYAAISPTTIKKYATANGRAKKVEMGASLLEEHELRFKTDDEVDAWYIGQLAVDCYLVAAGAAMGHLPKHRQETVKTVLKANNPMGTFCWETLGWKENPWRKTRKK